jgi:hypothetical protein
MMDTEETEDFEAATEIGRMISEFRQEFMDSIRTGIEAEVEKMEAEGFDPARGSGRGPLWAEGGSL